MQGCSLGHALSGTSMQCRLLIRSSLLRHAQISGQGMSSDGAGYKTLAEPHASVYEIKKSKFLSTCWPANTAQEAVSRIEAAKDLGASHNCYAYKVAGDQKCADDGEPGGTAGRPILGAIEGEDLDHAAVLVTRHFGGIKLGAGGLTRAYGTAARECLREAKHLTVEATRAARLKVPYSLMGSVYHLVEQHQAERESEEHLADASVQLTLRIRADQLEALQQALLNSTSGQIKLQPL